MEFEVKSWADVSLKPDFTVFAEKIIITLGGKINFPINITELINNLLQLLSQRRCLLIVDNLETLLDRERKCQDKNYQEFFRCFQQQGKNSTLLITTQDKPQLLQNLQQWYSLGGMKITEGVELFKKFKIVGTDDELKAFVEYLNGHPLTIKLVAGFLISYCDSQFSQAEELQLKQFNLAYDEASGSHRKQDDARLSWIIQQHLARLTLEQTEFLFSLSVYRLPFNGKAASYMLREKEVELIVVERKLQELCNRSLLTKIEDRKFQFESLVQKYVLQQANTLTNAHQQAIEYYQASLKERKFGQVLEDVSEYLEIVDHYCELKQYAAANKVLNCCWNFLKSKGYYRVLVKISEKLIQGWQSNLQPEDKSDYANALTGLGNAYGCLGEYQREIESHQQVLGIAREIGDRSQEGGSLCNLGNAYHHRKQYKEVIDYYHQALVILQEIGHCQFQASTLGDLGLAYTSTAQYEKAIDYSQQALKIARKINYQPGESNAVNSLAIAYQESGEYQQAIEYYQQALEIARKIGDRSNEGGFLCNLGNAYNSLEQYEEAIKYHEQALVILQEIGHRQFQANTLLGLGNAYDSLEQHEEAIRYYEQALKIARKIGGRYQEGGSLCNLGNVYNSLEQHEEAIKYYEQALIILQKIGHRQFQANTLLGLGNAYNHLGKYQQAIKSHQQALEIARQIGDRKGIARFWFNLGNTWKNSQQKSEAVAAYEKAKVLYQEAGLDKNVEKCNEAIQDLG